MKWSKLIAAAAVALPVTMAAQAPAASNADDEVIYEMGSVEFVHTNPELNIYLLKARPAERESVGVPKFALRTKNKKFVMAIGGKINPIMGYDIGNDLYNADGGGIDFTTGAIPVPAVDGHRGAFFINPLKAYVDFTVVGLAGTENQITGYVQLKTNGMQNGIRLHRAYINWRGFTMGQNATLMADGDAASPALIDPQGPSGKVSHTAYTLTYKSKDYNGFSFAAGIEKPTFYSANGIYRGPDYTHSPYFGKPVTGEVSQLAPDVPVYVEYKAPDSANRVRLSAVARSFFYRDLLANKTAYQPGWGVMLSGNFSFYKPLTFNYQAVYGRGIGDYIQDIAGREISFVPSSLHVGKMWSTPMMGLIFGASYNATKRLQFNAVGSYARVWECRDYAITADDNNYHYGIYAAANCFYKISDYFTWSIEYDFGRHATWDHGAANDSRVQTQFIFTF